MTKKELAERYKKLISITNGSEYLPTITVDTIGKAYEDGYDEAVELACDFIGSIRRIDDSIIEDFKKYLEE